MRKGEETFSLRSIKEAKERKKVKSRRRFFLPERHTQLGLDDEKDEK